VIFHIITLTNRKNTPNLIQESNTKGALIIIFTELFFIEIKLIKLLIK
jgi:hypothetical protein